MRKSEEPIMLTVEEARNIARVGSSTIYFLLQTGQLPGRKVGGSWRISRAKLIEWLNEAGVTVAVGNRSASGWREHRERRHREREREQREQQKQEAMATG